MCTRRVTGAVLVVIAALLLSTHIPSGCVAQGVNPVLSGEVESVAVVDQCSNLSTDDLQYVLESVPGSGALDNATDDTVCGLFGDETSVTTVTISLEANQVAGQDDIVFEIPGPPNVGASGTPDGDTDCYAVLDGQNCAVYNQSMVFTFSTTNAVAVHKSKPYPRDVAYGMYWLQSASLETSTFVGAASARSFFTRRVSEVSTNIADKLISPFEVIDSTTNVGRSGITSVCPSRTTGALSAGELDYYPDFPDRVDPDTGRFASLTSDPLILFCPTLLGVATLTQAWRAGYAERIVMNCLVYDLAEAPDIMLNARLDIGLQVTDPTTGAQSVQTISRIMLSTLQKGAEVVDPLGIVVASLVGFTSDAPLAQPRSGSVQECAACMHDSGDPDQDPSCKNGRRTDYAQPVEHGDFDPVYTTIPWRDTDGGKQCLMERCPIPAQVCSQTMFDDPGVRSQWSYVDPVTRNIGYGEGCSKNGQSDDFYGKNPSAAELMCGNQMGGTCMAGYEQTSPIEVATFTPEASATPCEIDVDRSISLDKYANQGEEVSFSDTMPDDFNNVQPQFAWDAGRMIEAIDGNAQVRFTVILRTTAAFHGEATEIATGVIVSAGMICGVPSNSGAGVISVLVKNTGTLAGNFIADAAFPATVSDAPSNNTASDATADPDDTTAGYAAEDIVPCTVSLEPNQNGTCTIRFEFAGPVDTDLEVTISLTSGTVVAGEANKVLSTAQGSCLVGAEITSSGAFGSPSFSDLFDPSGRSPYQDSADCPAYYFCVFCTPQDIGGILWCVALWLTFAIALLWAIIGDCFCIKYMVDKYRVVNIQSAALKQKKRGINASSMVTMMLLISGVSASTGAPPAHGWAASVSTSVMVMGAIVAIGMGSMANYSRRESARPSGDHTRTICAFVAATLLVASCSGQGVITGISSYNEYEVITDADGNVLINDGEPVTTLTMDIKTAVQDGLSTVAVNVNMTVVPNEATGDQASDQTSGSVCTASSNTTCQSTRRALMAFTADQAVLKFGLTPMDGLPDGAFLPWNYYYNQVTEIVDTNDPDVHSISDLATAGDGRTAGDGFCSLLSSHHTAGSTPFPTGIDIDAEFNDPASNSDHMRIPTNSQPPMNTFSSTAKGGTEYLFFCRHPCLASVASAPTACTTTVAVMSNFQNASPSCRAFTIDSLPALSVDMRMNITNPAAGIDETGTVRTITSGVQGASVVTTPNNLAALEIFGVAGGGSLGPSVGEILITCTSDGSDLNMVPDGINQGTNSVPPESLSFNPYRSINIADPSPGTCSITGEQYATDRLMPESCTLERITGETDPYAMMFIIDNTDVSKIGGSAGLYGVSDSLYATNGGRFDFASNMAPVVPLVSLIPREQGGAGTFENFFTGVPRFGAGTNFTAATVMGLQRSYQDGTAPYSGEFTGARLPPKAPFMPISYRNRGVTPNIWTRIPAGGGAPLLFMEPSSRSYSIKATATFSGTVLPYLSPVPNGDIDSSLTECLLDMSTTVGTVDGIVSYQVCNPATTGRPANYEVLPTCGLASTFNTQLSAFIGAPTARVVPTSRILGNVEPNSCRNVATDGGFIIEITATTAGITNGTDALLCVVNLLSQDTQVPSEMAFPPEVVQCRVSGAMRNASISDTPYYGYAPLDTRDPLVSPSPTPTPTDSDGNANEIEAAIFSVGAIVLVLGFCGLCVCMSALGIRSRRLNKELKAPSKPPPES